MEKIKCYRGGTGKSDAEAVSLDGLEWLISFTRKGCPDGSVTLTVEQLTALKLTLEKFKEEDLDYE